MVVYIRIYETFECLIYHDYTCTKLKNKPGVRKFCQPFNFTLVEAKIYLK